MKRGNPTIYSNTDRIKGIVLNEMPDRLRQLWCGVYVESEKNFECTEAHGRLVAAGGLEVGKMGRCWSRNKVPAIRGISNVHAVTVLKNADFIHERW